MDIGIKSRKALSLQLLEIGTTNPAFFMHLQKKAYFNTDKALLTLKIAETDSSGTISVMFENNNLKRYN